MNGDRSFYITKNWTLMYPWAVLLESSRFVENVGENTE